MKMKEAIVFLIESSVVNTKYQVKVSNCKQHVFIFLLVLGYSGSVPVSCADVLCLHFYVLFCLLRGMLMCLRVHREANAIVAFSSI